MYFLKGGYNGSRNTRTIGKIKQRKRAKERLGGCGIYKNTFTKNKIKQKGVYYENKSKQYTFRRKRKTYRKKSGYLFARQGNKKGNLDFLPLGRDESSNDKKDSGTFTKGVIK